MKEIMDDGIDSRNLFYPSNKQAFLTDKSCHNDFFPVSDDLYKKGMYVPSGSNLSRDDMVYIGEIIEEKFNKIKKELVIDNHKKSLGIVGLGYVGSAIYQGLKDSHNIFTFDIQKESNCSSLKELWIVQIIFL